MATAKMPSAKAAIRAFSMPMLGANGRGLSSVFATHGVSTVFPDATARWTRPERSVTPDSPVGTDAQGHARPRDRSVTKNRAIDELAASFASVEGVEALVLAGSMTSGLDDEG